MMRLTQQLFTWAPSAQWMEWYERALYNHILAASGSGEGHVHLQHVDETG